jgi:outer membrane protein
VGAGASKNNTFEDCSVYGSVNASVSLSLSLVKNIELARVNYESGQISYEAARRDVELSVRKSFYSLILAEENIALVSKNLATSEQQYARTLSKYKVGAATELDVLSARVAMENLRPDLASAEIMLENSMASFKQMTGIDTVETIILKGSLGEALPVKSTSIPETGGESPALTSLRKSLELAKVSKDLAMSRIYFPSVSLSWNYQPSRSTNALSDWADAGVFVAAVTLPLDGLFSWSSSSESIASADDTIKNIELQITDAKTTVELKQKSLLGQIAQSLSVLGARKLNAELAEKRYVMTEEAYRLGTKDLLTLQDSSDSLQAAKVSLLKEEYTLISAVLDLEYTTGVPFGTIGR